MDYDAFNYDALAGKRVLITGGLGFIGSNIALQCVALGAEVTLLDACLEPYGWNFENIEPIKNKVEFIKGDIRDKELIKKLVSGKDIIFHMAAQVGRELAMDDPILDTEINCIGTINLIEACRTKTSAPKVIFAGSRGQIGEQIYMPVDESHPENPTDIYGINKSASEKYLLLYGKIYDFPVVSLRLNNVYGPRCQMHAGFYGILNWFMSNAMSGKPITVYGEGNQTRDYIYITDVVDAFVRSALSDEANHEIFMVGSGVETVFIDMVETVVKIVGKGDIAHVDFPESRQKIDILRFVAKIEKMKEFLGWSPKIDLVTGVDKTFRFYEKNLDKYLNR